MKEDTISLVRGVKGSIVYHVTPRILKNRFHYTNIFYCLIKRFPLRLLFCDLNLKKIPRSTGFYHPYGITINQNTVLGKNCGIWSNVTIGRKQLDDANEAGAIIGNRVKLCAGCIIVGPVVIGDNATIGAAAVVLSDVPSGATVVGNPARIIGVISSHSPKNQQHH